MSPPQSPLRAVMAMIVLAATAGRSQTRAGYTASQAAEGLAAYQGNCARCHLPDLVGRNEAPPLAGGNFMNAWGSRTTAELIQYIQASMPPSSRGGLSEEAYTNIVAFFLQANGATAGDRPLALSTPVRIDSVAKDKCLRRCVKRWLETPLQISPGRPAPPRPKASALPARSGTTPQSPITRYAIPIPPTG